MASDLSNNSRIAKNTMFLYFRMVITMAITLFTSRVVLHTLGIEDFGVYNVVGGIIVVFQFFNASLSEGSQRFITYEIGKGKDGNIKKVFSTCVILHILLAIFIILLSEPIGVWFIHNKLMIPDDRLYAAIVVFHFSLIVAFVNIVNVPFYAMIIAYEKMKAFATISIIEAVIKLGIAYCLLLSDNFDRLILYGFLMLMSQVMIQLLYFFYCKIKIINSSIAFIIDLQLISDIGKFSSWTIVGSLSYLGVTQGLNLLLGVFFLPVVNAARGVAVQVQNAVNTFAKSFQTAINPQITKTYAAGQINEMHKLIFRSVKFSFFLLMYPMLPILFETDFILGIWLTNVPEYTASFIRLILLASWVNALANPLSISAKASGNIKKYELLAASIKLLVIPCGYICLKSGLPPYSVFSVYLFFEIVSLISNIYVTSTLIHYKQRDFYTMVISKCLSVVLIAIIAPAFIYILFEPGFTRFMILVVTTIFASSASIYFIGLIVPEQNFFKNKINVFLHHI